MLGYFVNSKGQNIPPIMFYVPIHGPNLTLINENLMCLKLFEFFNNFIIFEKKTIFHILLEIFKMRFVYFKHYNKTRLFRLGKLVKRYPNGPCSA
jgi:hypothetical protein